MSSRLRTLVVTCCQPDLLTMFLVLLDGVGDLVEANTEKKTRKQRRRKEFSNGGLF